MGVQLFNPDSPGPSEQCVRDVVTAYLANIPPGRCKRAHEDRAHVLRCFVDAYGDLLLRDAKPFHLRTWIDSQTSLHSNWTIRRWIAAVKACFRWALDMELIDRHPFLTVRHPAGKRGRPIEEAEYRAMLRLASDGLLKRFILFLHFTGCRPGEAGKAEWKDLDLGRCRIVLTEHKTAHVTGEDRIIYLHPALVRLLVWIRRHNPHPRWILVNRWGNCWKASALSQRMKVIRARAGIPKTAKWHGFRHGFATAAIENGVDLETLRQLLGHASIRTTSGYIHVGQRDRHMQEALSKAVRKH